MWVHGDLLPGNLLVNHGLLSAVIDWGGLNAGDPACDLQPAWNILAGHSRKLFLSELGADDDACLRGRGWTLFQAITGLYSPGHQPRDDPASLTRACTGPRRHVMPARTHGAVARGHQVHRLTQARWWSRP